ncbi:hypothetical protein ACFIJ5_10645 [Haloimpatiens sp. FM7330]|uniref:hypothetical protein n=1 Tax=Haloimpatiens sp. FM7330 TaxID=3298610 RepID=UPI003636AA7E
MELFSIIIIFIYTALIGIGIYGFILFVKLAHRGIKALDIYIEKNNNKFDK